MNREDETPTAEDHQDVETAQSGDHELPDEAVDDASGGTYGLLSLQGLASSQSSYANLDLEGVADRQRSLIEKKKNG